MSAPQMLETRLSVLMLYVTALRYSEPYFSHDVSSVEHVLRNKDEGSQNICFFGIVNCEPLVTIKIIGK